MTSPLVSVCLPNLDNLPFLQERIDTILGQTLTDWELVVSDNYSQDGAWEFFERLARQDSRVSIAQAPRHGLYANWNACIRRARGEFVYIATSDDGMAPDCLEKLANALIANEQCDVAHCHLVVVDEAGQPMPGHRAMAHGLFRRSAPELFDRPHVRRAPFDGLLCLLRDHRDDDPPLAVRASRTLRFAVGFDERLPLAHAGRTDREHGSRSRHLGDL